MPLARFPGSPLALLLLAAAVATSVGSPALAHKGPDPVSHWRFDEESVREDRVEARLGPAARIEGEPELVRDPEGSSLRFDGVDDALIVRPGVSDSVPMPGEKLTVAVWASVDEGHQRGTLVGTLEKNAYAERGWGLGYDGGRFTFTLSTIGADDGDGRRTVLRADKPLEPGRFHHVVGVYDGVEMRLYVDGHLEGASREQFGPIYQGMASAYAIGASADRDERSFHRGRVRDVAVYDLAASGEWAAHAFEDARAIAALDPESLGDKPFDFLVAPYLQYVTRDRVSVCWETTAPSTGRVLFGESGNLKDSRASGEPTKLHTVRLDGLATGTPYYYRVEATDDSGVRRNSPLLSFQTAPDESSPYAFGVLGDTQLNPRVSKALTDQLWAQRPNFVIIAGDLTDNGPTKHHWTDHFFPGMQPLASRVAFFPVLGNHERDTRHYYRYMDLPDPEYYYTFRYGNSEFFMIDSNREVGPGSEQYAWLERDLAASRATWKFACYHHPSYSSDEDDYGDLWNGGKSTYGDTRIRPMLTLFDKHGVDIVWNGHIHSYERTWPIIGGKVVESGGTVYMITGGAGGGLETAGPIKPAFQNNVKHGHHAVLVGVNGRTLELKAFDLEGRLFDYVKLDKRDALNQASDASANGSPSGATVKATNEKR